MTPITIGSKALFIKAMTPRAVERLRPMIQHRVDTLLDVGAAAGIRYLSDFAARIPTQVILDLLGLPDSGEAMMRHWCRPLLQFPASTVAPDKEAMAHTRGSLRGAAGLFHAGDRQRRKQAAEHLDQRHGSG